MGIFWRLSALLVALALFNSTCEAQVGPGGGVQQQGAVSVGDCTKWVGQGTIADAGSPCGGSGGSPGGSNTQVQYNFAGSFGGISGATSNGTTITLVAPILGTPASATLTNATGLPISTGVSGLATGIATFLGTPTSANLATALTDETGTGSAVFGTAPTISSPTFNTAATFAFISGSTQCLHVSTSGVLSGTGADCGSGGSSGANPTATAGPTAVNGTSANFMRSDGAPAIQKATSGQFGIVEVDGTTITASAGVISAVGGSGTVTSVATGPGTAGGPITTTGTISAALVARTNSTTSDTILTTDSGGVVYESNTGSIAVTLPVATTTGFGSGTFFLVCNINTGVATITPTTSTIGGAISYALAAGTALAPTCLGFQSNGTNYNLVQTPSASGSGTVTSVSVTTANGVSGTVATATTTPAITLTLGAITPTTVNGNTFTTGTGTLTLAAGKTLTDTSAVGASVLLGATGGGFTALAGNSCTNQAGVSISAAGVLGCASITNAFLTAGSFTNITGVGTLTAGTLSTGVVVGGVTMTLGSDATGDIYYRAAGGVLTRLAVGTGTQVLGVSGGLPAWVAGGGSSTITAGTTVTSGITSGDIISSTSNLVADSGVAVSNLVLLNAANNHTAANTFSAAGALSTPGVTISGAPITGGSGTTTFPQTYLNAGAAPTTFSTAGTMLGINTPSGFTGNYLDIHLNGGPSIFSILALSGSATVTNASSATSAQVLLSMRNGSANSAAAGVWNFGNNTSNIETTFTLNSSANTGGNGMSSFTINNSEATNTGGIYLQTVGTNAITISKTQAVGMPGLAASSAAQTGTVCWTTGGNLTVDTTVGCLTSLLAAKNITERLTPAKAMSIVARLDPFAFRYKQGWGDSGRYEQFGLGAEEVALVDERLVGRDPEGKIQGVRYQELTAVLIGAIKEQQAEIESLKRRRH
jgi:hypothetical protein